MKPVNITIRKLWLLALMLYALYFFYALFAAVRASSSSEGWQLLGYVDFWAFVFNNTVAFLTVVLAVAGTLTIFGPDMLLAPVRALTSTSKVLPTTDSAVAQSERKPAANFNDFYQLHWDYHEDVKRIYNHIINQYTRSFNFSLLFAVLGFGLILYALLFKPDAHPNWPAVFVSAVIESVPVLFFYLSDRARSQLMRVLPDLRRDDEIARAFKLLETIQDEQARERIKEETVRAILLRSA